MLRLYKIPEDGSGNLAEFLFFLLFPDEGFYLVPKITCPEAVVQVRCLAVVVLQLLIGHTGANRNMAAGREAGSRSGTYNSGTIPQACNPAPLVHRGHRLIGAGPGKRNGGKLVLGRNSG